MNELVVVFAICLFVALAAYAVRGFIGRSSGRLEEMDLEESEAYKKSPHDELGAPATKNWRELDRQRTRRDVRHHWQ